MTRAPVIKTSSASDALKIKQWFIDNFQELKEIAESTTSHGKLLKIDPILIVGTYVYPRFVYSTGDSMGMNMVTIASEKILDKLADETTGRHPEQDVLCSCDSLSGLEISKTETGIKLNQYFDKYTIEKF